MRHANKLTYYEQVQDVVAQYREAGQPWPTDKRTIAAWAYEQGLMKPTRKSVIDQLANEIGRAMRNEYMTDPQGRTIRRKHARRVEVQTETGELKQMTIWDDIQTATPEHMQRSFQQRRNMTLADCFHHKQEVDSYNQNWNDGAPLKFTYDFNEDLEEKEMPTDYPTGDDAGDGHEEDIR